MFSKIASTFSTKVITSMINLLVVIIISRAMGPEGKGEASLIITSIALVMMLCNIIGGATLVYLVPRYNFFQLFLLSWAWTVLICSAAFTVWYTGRSWLPPTVLDRYPIAIFELSVLSSFMSINLTLLLGKERIMSNNLISLLQSLLNLGLLALFIFGMKEPTILSYIQTLYLTFGACTLISLLLIAKHFTSFSLQGFSSVIGESFRLGLANQAGHVMQFLSLRLSFYMLDEVRGRDAVGIYSNGVSIVESIWLITNSIAIVQYARIANSDDRVYAQQLTLKLIRLSTLVCIPALIIMAALPPSFYVWLFGTGFEGVTFVIWTLAPGVLFYNTGLITGHYFSGIGKYHVNTMANFLGLVLTATASFLLLSRYDASLAGLIASGSYAVMSLYVLSCFLKESKAPVAELLPRLSEAREIYSYIRNRNSSS